MKTLNWPRVSAFGFRPYRHSFLGLQLATKKKKDESDLNLAANITYDQGSFGCAARGCFSKSKLTGQEKNGIRVQAAFVTLCKYYSFPGTTDNITAYIKDLFKVSHDRTI